jgi:hypothetical protein
MEAAQLARLEAAIAAVHATAGMTPDCDLSVTLPMNDARSILGLLYLGRDRA